MCLLFATVTKSQQSTPTNERTKADYLKISKTQKTAGFVLLGIGAVCFAIAAPGNVSFDVLPALVIGGGAAALGSIPLFIASGRNKRKAASIALKNQFIPRMNNPGLMNRAIPSVSLKINF